MKTLLPRYALRDEVDGAALEIPGILMGVRRAIKLLLSTAFWFRDLCIQLTETTFTPRFGVKLNQSKLRKRRDATKHRHSPKAQRRGLQG